MFSRSGGHKTKETYPTRPGSPTPCKQGLKVRKALRFYRIKTHGGLKCKISPPVAYMKGWTYVSKRTILSEPKFRGCIDSQAFLPMVRRFARFARFARASAPLNRCVIISVSAVLRYMFIDGRRPVIK